MLPCRPDFKLKFYSQVRRGHHESGIRKSVPESTRTPFQGSLVAATTSMILTGSVTPFLIVLLGPLVWILRDGLGPSSTESRGLQAFEKMFRTFYWGRSPPLRHSLFWDLCYGESESCESSMGHADLKDKRPNFVSYANSFILNILRDRHEHP